MSLYVFLGPTLPVEEARRVLDATYLPPAAMGDVQALLARGPRAIALVDGYFERTPAVWHKELLHALSRGVRVLGASSMGALRAAELHPFGMEGVGRVFQAYRDGELEDEDEVAVTHGPADTGYRALSEAMVNLREGLRRAQAEGLLRAPSHRALLEEAKALYYPERSWPRLLELGARRGVDAEELAALAGFVAREQPNLKRADALALLEHLARAPAGCPATPPPSFEFHPTRFWHRMVELETRVGVEEDPRGLGVRAEDFGRHVRLVAERPRELLRGALLLYLASGEGPAVEGLDPSTSPEALEGLLEQLPSIHRPGVDRFLPAELRRRGLLAPLLRAALRKRDFLQNAGLMHPTPLNAGLSPVALLEWYTRCYAREQGAPTSTARENGFSSEEEFLSELSAQYLYERAHPLDSS